MKTQITGLLVLLMCIASLSGCQKQSTENNQRFEDNCILPLESFAYSPWPNRLVPDESVMQIPPAWEAAMDIPDDYYLNITRETQAGIELWFDQAVRETPDGPEKRVYHIYNIETKVWETVSGEYEGSGVLITNLLIDPDNGVWAQNTVKMPSLNGGNEPHPLLSKFNEEKRVFELVDETFILPIDQTNGLDNPVIRIKIDPQGLVWIFIAQDAIYSYDPQTREMKKRIDIPGIGIYSPVFSSDGIYFLDISGVVVLSSDVRILLYSLEENTIEQVPARLNPWPPIPNLLMDHKNRLWLGGVAYFDENGALFLLEPSPIFIINFMESGMDYRWEPPNALTESSDGRLWFRTRNGLAWLDLDEQKWCWVSTSQSKVIEDPQHTLRMTAYGKLYKQPIVPVK